MVFHFYPSSSFIPPSLHCQVSILRSTTIILSPTTEMDVALQFRGFIHPLLGAPPPASAPTETVSMWARIQRLHFEAQIASGPNSSQLVREGFAGERSQAGGFSNTLLSTCLWSLVQEVVGRWTAQQEKELKLLSRADGSKLFSNPTRGNHYLVQAEGYLNNSGSGQASEMALIWNRTLPGGSVSVNIWFVCQTFFFFMFFFFLQLVGM